jgi:hypothetical protein
MLLYGSAAYIWPSIGAIKKKKKKTLLSVEAESTTEHRHNLTLQDWLTVFAFIDDHPSLNQGEVVVHFSSAREI